MVLASSSPIGTSQFPITMTQFQTLLPHYLERIEQVLEHHLPATGVSEQLYAAMRYAVLGGGKRIRPLLVYASGALLQVNQEYLDAAAAAIELIHAYSLVHDDLPAMDDDDLRRNRPTLHRAYDEATAILAGDALQTLAFEVLATVPDILEEPLDSQIFMRQRVQALALLAHAAGAKGMVAGQMLDMQGEGQRLNQQQIETMFRLKTGMLLHAAILLPVYGDRVIEADTVAYLMEFAEAIGLAFQIRDDILDVEGDTAVIGKPQGSDQEHDKATYPARLGMEYAKQRVETLYAHALSQLAPLGVAADPLRYMARYIIYRDY